MSTHPVGEQPWIPTVAGLPIDLVEPRVDQVDFRAMAHALAHTNRYMGHGETQVSVAHHLLIGLDLCPEALRPWWLIHDGHEWALGDITTPTLMALSMLANELEGAAGGQVVRDAVAEFKRRHDSVIHAAAGLRLPTFAQRTALDEIDQRCLATEHRDFHRPSTRPWRHEIAGTAPAPRITKWLAPVKVEEQLLARFTRYLPALAAMAA